MSPDLISPDGSINPTRFVSLVDSINAHMEQNREAYHKMDRDQAERHAEMKTIVEYQGKELVAFREKIASFETRLDELVRKSDFDTREHEQDLAIQDVASQIADMRKCVDSHDKQNVKDFAEMKSLIEAKFSEYDARRHSASEWSLKRYSALIATIAIALTIVGLILQAV